MSPLLRRRRGRRPVRHRTPAQIVRRNVLWGAATLLAAAIIVFLVFGGGVPGTGPKQLEILTKDAGVLRVGQATKVRVAGVDVGTVSGLEPAKDRPGYSLLTVDLTKEAPVFRRDATVKIRPRLFLEGNFFLDISPGSPGTPALGDRPIPPGAVTLHVAADEVFSAFDAQTRDNFKETLKAFGEGLEDGGAEAFNRLLKATPPALTDIAKVTKSARGNQDGDLRTLVREAGGVLANLEEHEDGLEGTIRDGRRTFDAFAENQADLRRTIASLDSTTEGLMPELSRIIAATPQARALIRDARPLARRLPSFLDIANPGLRSLQRLAESGDVQGLTAELRPMLATISRSAAPLGAFGDDIRPVAKCLNDNILPILNGVVPDGSLTTNLKVYEELADTFTGLGASTESFDANGPWIRYLAGLGNSEALTTTDGGGTLSATAERPVSGSTPTPVTAPPLRPDVPCETQAVPSLESRTKPFEGTQTKAKIDKEQVTDVLDRGLETLKGLDSKGEDIAALQAQLAALLGPETAAEAKGRTTTPAPSTTPAEPAAAAKKAAKAADAAKTTPATTTGASR
jgi:ABC-type transporter Mla subunit MlaD